MIENVLKDYFEGTPGINPVRIENIRKIMENYDAEYLSECVDETMHAAYLCAFLYRLDRVPDDQLKDYRTALQNEDIQFYLEMDENEKRLDAKPFKRNDPQLRKAREIRANILKIAMDKMNGCLKPEEIELSRSYMNVIPQIRSSAAFMSFSARRETEQLLSDSLLDLSYILEDLAQYSPELYNYFIRSHSGSE